MKDIRLITWYMMALLLFCVTDQLVVLFCESHGFNYPLWLQKIVFLILCVLFLLCAAKGLKHRGAEDDADNSFKQPDDSQPTNLSNSGEQATQTEILALWAAVRGLTDDLNALRQQARQTRRFNYQFLLLQIAILIVLILHWLGLSPTKPEYKTTELTPRSAEYVFVPASCRLLFASDSSVIHFCHDGHTPTSRLVSHARATGGATRGLLETIPSQTCDGLSPLFSQALYPNQIIQTTDGLAYPAILARDKYV